MIVVQFPCAMNNLPVLFNLFSSQLWSTLGEPVRGNRHNVRRSIRQPNTCTRKRHLHHVFREVTCRMHHVLVSRSDVATSCVVVSTEMRRKAATACCS